MTDNLKTCNTNNNDNTKNCNSQNLENDHRDERHPLSVPQPPPSVAMNNHQLNDIINSILSSVPNQSSVPANEEGSVQYLLPVDLLVSVNKKSNVKKIEAAIPSSFAMYPPLIPSYPAFFQQSRSTLNPSAASFTPSHPATPMDPIAEYQSEGSNDSDNVNDPWCTLDKPEKKMHPITPSQKYSTLKEMKPFKATKRRIPFNQHTHSHSHRAFHKNWRNRTGQFQELSSFKSPRLLAEFVAHVTLQNREECQPDTVLTKTWRMKNIGDTAWGYDVELVYCKGDEFLSLYDRYPVINAQSGQEVDISATIKTGKNAGRYCTYFRLMKKGKHFGPRVWCDIIVSNGMGMDKRRQCGVEMKEEEENKPKGINGE